MRGDVDLLACVILQTEEVHGRVLQERKGRKEEDLLPLVHVDPLVYPYELLVHSC